MNRLMIVARLREGAHEEAEVIFFFEAPEVEWIVNDIVDDPMISAAFGPWEKLIEGTPRLAHERFYWSRESSKIGVGLGV